MKTRLYLVRHAAVDYIPDDYHRPLSVRGKRDAERVTAFFDDKHVDRVFSSPYIRAVDTVVGVARKRGMKVERIDDCRERKSAPGHIENYQSFVRRQWNDFDYHLEGGESLNQTQSRAVRAAEKIREKCRGETAVVGTHGTWLAVFLHHYYDRVDYHFWKAIRSPDIFLIEFSDEKLLAVKQCCF